MEILTYIQEHLADANQILDHWPILPLLLNLVFELTWKQIIRSWRDRNRLHSKCRPEAYFWRMDFIHFFDSDLELMDEVIGYKGDKSAKLPLNRIHNRIAKRHQLDAGTHPDDERIERRENLLEMLRQLDYIDIKWSGNGFSGPRSVKLNAPAIAAFTAGGFKALKRAQRWEKYKKDMAFWFSVLALVISLATFAAKAPSIYAEWTRPLENKTKQH